VALYERLGRYSAAARFALAATRQVAAALPAQEQLAARAQAQGRLWATAFGYCMECARYEVRPGSTLAAAAAAAAAPWLLSAWRVPLKASLALRQASTSPFMCL
jgi:hypothetical protein